MNLDAHNSYNLRSASSWAKVLGVWSYYRLYIDCFNVSTVE
jgi:hypothetical protein